MIGLRIIKVTLLIAVVAVAVSARLAPWEWYCILDALAWALAFLMFTILFSRPVRIIALAGLFGALNNLADELFFDPVKLQWNEVVFGLLILAYVPIAFWIYYRRQRSL